MHFGVFIWSVSPMPNCSVYTGWFSAFSAVLMVNFTKDNVQTGNPGGWSFPNKSISDDVWKYLSLLLGPPW